MKRGYLFLVLMVISVVVAAAGCSQAAPAAAPTQAPAAAAKAAEPTRPVAAATPAPGVAPTVAPTPRPASFPIKGKPVMYVNPFAAGGAGDVVARYQAPILEKEWGVPVQVVNNPGAGGQVALTDLAKSNLDGHTIVYATLPASITTYVDPERKAVFGRKDLQPVALHFVGPMALAVKSDGPYKSLKDLVDAAKAKPGQVKMATSGVFGVAHLGMLLLEKASGAKFAPVHFDGGPPGTTALMGGHVDFHIINIANYMGLWKSGEVRLLGIMDKSESPGFPGVRTFEAQGYKNCEMATSQGWVVRGGTPAEIVNTLSATSKKVLEMPEHVTKLAEMGLVARYMNPTDYSDYWDGLETMVKQMMAENPTK